MTFIGSLLRKRSKSVANVNAGIKNTNAGPKMTQPTDLYRRFYNGWKLLERGDAVRTFLLKGNPAACLIPGRWKWRRGTSATPLPWRFFAVPEGTEAVVIHMTGSVSLNEESQQRLMDVNVGGTKNIIAQRRRIRRPGSWCTSVLPAPFRCGPWAPSGRCTTLTRRGWWAVTAAVRSWTSRRCWTRFINTDWMPRLCSRRGF